MLEQEITEYEAASLLRVSPRFLRERGAGRIAFAQRRRRILYPESCIRKYQESQLTRGSHQPAKSTGRRLLSDVRNIGRRVLFATS